MIILLNSLIPENNADKTVTQFTQRKKTHMSKPNENGSTATTCSLKFLFLSSSLLSAIARCQVWNSKECNLTSKNLHNGSSGLYNYILYIMLMYQG